MKKPLPPLRRIHTNDTLESGASNFSLEYWRQRKTEDIIESLRPGKLFSRQPLIRAALSAAAKESECQ